MKLRVCFMFALAVAIVAHPLGNFSANHYTHLEVSADGVEITYVLDLAEVPTYTLLRDWNLASKSPQPELDRKAAEQAQVWARGLELRAAGQPVAPRFISATIKVSEVPGGLAVARVVSTFAVPGAKAPLEFQDHNYPDRAGWKEIVISSGPGVQIVTASQDAVDRSKELEDYPANTTAIAPQDLRASVDWRASNGPPPPARIVPIDQPTPVAFPTSPETVSPAGPASNGDYLSRLLAQKQIGWPWLLVGLVVAFGLGGAHALEPGHGKTLVAAYLVGSRGTMKHAALLGAMVTFTHTISVFLLGLATLFLAKSVVPDRVIRVLEAISGLSIVVIGLVMLIHRVRHLRADEHADDHAHEHAHAHDDGHTHTHDHHHAHTYAHHHPHDHEHGPHTHTHLPEGEITAGSLIALGISGGLVPCPAALVIMLAAIAFGHVGAGLILLVAFSLGLALVLMAAGMMVLYARSWLPNPSVTSHHPIFRLVPVFSAIIIVCIGLLMTGVSLGWLRPGLPV